MRLAFAARTHRALPEPCDIKYGDMVCAVKLNIRLCISLSASTPYQPGNRLCWNPARFCHIMRLGRLHCREFHGGVLYVSERQGPSPTTYDSEIEQVIGKEVMGTADRCCERSPKRADAGLLPDRPTRSGGFATVGFTALARPIRHRVPWWMRRCCMYLR